MCFFHAVNWVAKRSVLSPTRPRCTRFVSCISLSYLWGDTMFFFQRSSINVMVEKTRLYVLVGYL